MTIRLQSIHLLCVALVVLGTAGRPGAYFSQTIADPGAPAAVLDRNLVPAASRNEAILTTKRFGRYAVTVQSDQGVALQLVDRMAGPGAVRGTPGLEDGRLDVFLDRGESKIIALGHAEAQGEAQLSVHPSRELNDPPPRLVELKPVAESLGDFEQRSYWVELPSRSWAHLEAAGRNLRDLRLWRDGAWLVDAEPSVEILDPEVGRPLLACRLVVDLEPGLYLLTAYGGMGQPRAEESDEHPFHLRWGIPTLGVAGRARHQTGPLGIDRWLVPARANYYRLELPEAKPVEFRVTPYDERRPFDVGGAGGRIDKSSRVPMAEVNTSSRNDGFDLVTVRAPAGEPYLLQHFEALYQYRFSESGPHWASTVHSGHPVDSVDATAILVRYRRHGVLDKRPAAVQTIDVDSSRGWSRRANLLEPLTVFVRANETRSYQVDLEGIAARYRFEPFLISRPRDYTTPPFRLAGTRWDLDEGYHVLSVEPVEKGIVTVTLRGQTLDELAPYRASVRFPRLELSTGYRYVLHLNRQPGVKAGVVLRALPLDLTEPLPLSLGPGESVEVPFQAGEKGIVSCLAEDGSALHLALPGGPVQPELTVDSGRHTVTVRNAREKTLIGSLLLKPARLARDAPLPRLPDTALASLPKFPAIAEGAPQFFDLQRQSRKTFLLRAERDALYRLETQGLLDTEGALRSRTIPSLAASSGGGSGRNFFLQQYLRSGDYQVTVATRGGSAGHLGLSLTPTDPADGGELAEGIPARVELKGGEAVVYTFTITEAGEYRLRSLGLGRSFRCRLEDGEGWPVERPNIRADIRRRFEPGRYRFVLLPEPVASRRVTVLERFREPPSFAGHGPHDLPLANRVKNVWREPEAGTERVPDVWRFAVPAATDLSIHVTGGMQGRLLSADRDRPEVASLPPNRGWDGRLESGAYRLEVTCARINNLAPYEITVQPRALLPGLTQRVTAPARIPVAVGSRDLTEITSFGSADVRARLLDAQERVVASGDDREGDWNFHLAARLDPGDYSLEVEPVGTGSATTEVLMAARPEILHDALGLPADTELAPGTKVHLFPVLPASTSAAEFLLVRARSRESVGIAVEVERGGSWQTLAADSGRRVLLELPLPANGPFRLRVWSLDLRGNPVELTARGVSPGRVSERALAAGVALEAMTDLNVAVAAIELERPGTFRLGPEDRGVRWSPAAGLPLRTARNGLMPCSGSTAWVSVGNRPAPSVRASRVILKHDQTVQIPVAGSDITRVDVAPEANGPLLVLASAMMGQPGVAIEGAVSGSGREKPGQTGAVALRAAAALALTPERLTAAAWSAAPSAEPFDVRLRGLSYPPALPAPGRFGRWEGALRGFEARAFSLPEGPKRLRLAATPGVAVAVVEADTVKSLHWAGGQPLTETLETTGRALLFLHTREEGDRFAVEMLPAAEVRSLAPGGRFEEVTVTAGTLRVPVSGGPGTLHVAGEAESATFVSNSGEVRRGLQIRVAEEGGALLTRHGVGLVSAWMTSGKGGEDEASSPPAAFVSTPARLRLAGREQSFQLHPAEPVLLHANLEAGAVIRLAAGTESRTWIRPQGGSLHAYLPAGPAELALRAVGSAALSGSLELTTSPVAAIGEGLGPEILLPPGGGRAYRLSVAQPGSVGIGVRADADVVVCDLLDAGGRLVGRGVVQMHDLEAGTYVMVLRTPVDAPPVRARPAAVGIERPSTDPPADVIRGYVGAGQE